MFSEPSLQFILNTLLAVQTEVGCMRLGLHSTEERIGQLERAAYTPPTLLTGPGQTLESVPTSINGASSLASTIKTETNEQALEQRPQSSPKEEPAGEVCQCPCDNTYDLQRQLQPITHGISTLTEQLLRIENAIARPSSTNALQTGAPSRLDEAKKVVDISSSVSQRHTPSLQSPILPPSKQSPTPKGPAIVLSPKDGAYVVVRRVIG
jgi:hypothetical protein